MIVRESIYEGIKHLSPRSEEEIEKQFDDITENVTEKVTYACKNGLLWAVKKIFKSDMNVITHGGFAIAHAVIRNNLDIIEYLMERGADPSFAVYPNDNSALSHALSNFKFDIIANRDTTKTMKIVDLLLKDKRVKGAIPYLSNHDREALEIYKEKNKQ